MELSAYQRQAQETDQMKGKANEAMLVPLLGLAGEVGSLLVEYKKQLRDGPAHRLYREQVSEDLGDVLWYVANIASKHDLDLDTIARENLSKTTARWPRADARQRLLPQFFDEQFPEYEQFPREFDVSIRTTSDGKVECFWNEMRLGDEIDDNAYEDDGYRFHDVFHLSYVAVLGWSPIVRSHMHKKRRSNKLVDDVEDGGRARVIDEAVSAIVYDYARRHGYFENVEAVDFGLLKTVKRLVNHLEVAQCTLAEWEKAVLQGYTAWRLIRANRGGTLHLDLHQRTIVAKSIVL